MGFLEIVIATAVGAFLGGSGLIIWQIYTSRKNNYDNKFKALEQLINHLKNQFNAFITDSLSGKLKEPSAYLAASSPVYITEAGEQLFQASGITQYVESILHQYRQELDKLSDPVGIEVICKSIADKEIDSKKSSIKKIKKHFYDEGLSLYFRL